VVSPEGTLEASAFGNPVADSGSYFLSIYDYAAAAAELVVEAQIAGAGSCDGAPCWKAVADKGWSYKDKRGDSDGITQVKFKGGAAGKPSLQISGKGENLPLPAAFSDERTFQQDGLVVVQLQNENRGDCWTSSFAATQTGKNNGLTFKAAAH
jgi:hypothetical protein